HSSDSFPSTIAKLVELWCVILSNGNTSNYKGNSLPKGAVQYIRLLLERVDKDLESKGKTTKGKRQLQIPNSTTSSEFPTHPLSRQSTLPSSFTEFDAIGALIPLILPLHGHHDRHLEADLVPMLENLERRSEDEPTAPKANSERRTGRETSTRDWKRRGIGNKTGGGLSLRRCHFPSVPTPFLLSGASPSGGIPRSRDREIKEKKIGIERATRERGPSIARSSRRPSPSDPRRVSQTPDPKNSRWRRAKKGRRP
ncbi:hypothetical protein B296_00023341, partial [Ensete ventricosum]